MKPGSGPANPYPGLRPFQADEAHLFFGRDEQRVELLGRLRRSRFLAIVGSSGSGKSSLVRAGLLPGLYGGFMAGEGSQWRIVDMRPGTDPIGNLARALDAPETLQEEAQDVDESFTEVSLRRSGLGLVQVVREARLPPGDRVLVLVDQFEELFRALEQTDDVRADDDASAFVKLLLEAARQDDLPIFVVLTMRSDFLGECARFRDLPEAINDGQYLIPRLTRDQRREAITGPAAVHGVTLSPTLVNRLLNDVGEIPGQLPILQHALMRTWNLWAHPGGEVIDLPDYERVGGMAEALSRHADAVLESLSPPSRQLTAERLFRALTAIGASGREVRRLVRVQNVAEIAGTSVDEVLAVVEAFRAPGNAFLMPPAGEPLSASSTIDISHESLIRNWETLRGWLDAEARSARNYELLATTAAKHAEGTAGLWRDPELGVALAWREAQAPSRTWAQRYQGDFVQAMEFLDDSHARALTNEATRSRRTRIRRTAFGLVFLAMLTAPLNWALDWRADSREIAKAGIEASSILAGLSLSAQMRELYEARDLGTASDAGSLCTHQSPVMSDWTKDVLKSLCDNRAEFATFPTSAEVRDSSASTPRNLEAETKEDYSARGQSEAATSLDEFLTVVDLLRDGKIVEASEITEKIPDGSPYWEHAEQLIMDVGSMESEEIRSERDDLVDQVIGTYERYWEDPSSSAPAATRGLYKHPVHRAVFRKLKVLEGKLRQRALGDIGLFELKLLLIITPTEGRKAIQAVIDSRSQLRSRSTLPHSVGVQVYELMAIDPTVRLLFETEYEDAAVELPSLALIAYESMAENAEKPRYGRAALESWSSQGVVFMRRISQETGLESGRDLIRVLWVVLTVPVWKIWRRLSRWWKSRQGRSIQPRPTALRRALASLIDGCIGLGIAVLVGVLTAITVGKLETGDEFDDLSVIGLALLALLSYLLFCDAIKFKYCRSIGKILFDLRPVRDAGADRGAIGFGVSAKRNAPFIIALVVALAVSVVPAMMAVYAGSGAEGINVAALILLASFYLFYASDSMRQASDRWFGRRLSKWVFRPLFAALFWPSWFISSGSRTVGDRWSRTQIIDADSEKSLRIELPPRYISPDPGHPQAAVAA